MELATAGEALKAGLRHLIFTEALAADATANLDLAREHTSDNRADLRARDDSSRRSLAISRIERQEQRIAKADAHKRRVRQLLWPADEDEVTGGR